MNDEVCWFPTVGGCFIPAVVIYKAGTKELPVCAAHAEQMEKRNGFTRVNLP